MNVESLSKAELLMLLSILEGELEAQDLVIQTLKAQQRDAFIQEQYGCYDLSDPFLALQRDSEVMQGQEQGETQARGHGSRGQSKPSPLAVLKLVMTHCKRMQEKMMAQLAAAETRHKRVIADLEEEKRRHAQDTADGDDVTYMLEKERQRLLQQLESERARAERLERECQSLSNQVQEDLEKQQLSSNLTKECQLASARAQEENERVTQLCGQLEQERSTKQSLQGALEQERTRTLQMEARAEHQLAEFNTELEQMRSRLRKEENHSRELQELIETLRQELEEVKEREKELRKKAEEEELKARDKQAKIVSTTTASQTETDGKGGSLEKSQRLRLNGHQMRKESEEEQSTENGGVENGGVLSSPVQANQSLSPSSTACSSLSSSPCSSPVLTKRLTSLGSCSPTYPSSYQASMNQRFQAARHKFQQQAEQGAGIPLSPRELSPTSTPVPPLSDNSNAKQIARNTVTQVLSRFTNQQSPSKTAVPNSSPFGTDYRTLAASFSPTGKGPCPLSTSIRSPIIPRGERSPMQPVPLKKPGLNSPSSPAASPHNTHFPELSGSCGISSTQEGNKDLDLLLSKSS